MSISKIILLQKAARNVCADSCFCNRWVPLKSIERGIKLRYPYESLHISKATLSKSLGKIEPMIGSLDSKHPSGFYQAKMGNEFLFYIQDPKSDPPEFMKTATGVKADLVKRWQDILREDNLNLINYNNRMLRKIERNRNKKRKINDIDEVDVYLDSLAYKANTVALSKNRVMKDDDSKFGYWTSVEARLLFNPMSGESVINCLHRRMQLLLDATTNDVVLLSIISGIDNLNELTTKQKENIRMQSLYLRNSYDNALSSMNQRTWAQCNSFAIEILSDPGFNYIKNEKTIGRWHIQFRKGDQFIVPNSKLAREPKLFNFSHKRKQQ